MSFFMSADYSLSTKVMEIIYFIIGLLCIYCGVKNLKDKENPEPMGTFIFWAVLGIVLAPVSYTHLDVYKRQALNCGYRIPHSGPFGKRKCTIFAI